MKPVEYVEAEAVLTEIENKFEAVIEQAKNEVESCSLPVMSDISSKPYEDYRCITNTSSIQYQLLHQEGVIHNANGTISIDGYYFSALGSPYGDVGQRFIFVLERADGTRHQVKIIKGDAKQDRHTINNQGWLGQDGHILEMIVNTNYLTSEAKLHGDCNYIPELEGKVIKIIRMEETNEKYNGN